MLKKLSMIFLSFLIIINTLLLPNVYSQESNEIHLGVDGLIELNENNDGSKLYIGKYNEEYLKWNVLNKSMNFNGDKGVTLSLKSEYNQDDNGEKFFIDAFNDFDKTAILDLQAGNINENNWNFGMMLNVNNILFTMPATYNSDNFKKVHESNNLELKPVLLGTKDDVIATLKEETSFKENQENVLHFYHLSVSSIFTDANQLSGMLVNESGKVLYYGRINDVNSTETEIILPELQVGKYSFVVFGEQVNGDYIPNYSTNFSVLNFVVEEEEIYEELNQNVEVDSNENVNQDETYDPLDELCNDDNCSHVYRDLDGYLNPICERGEYIIMVEEYGVSFFANSSDENLALGKNCVAKLASNDTNVSVNESFPLGNAVNENISSGNYVDFGYKEGSNEIEASTYFQVDLGKVYELSRIKLYRYWLDSRMYRGTVIAVAKNESDFKSGKATFVYNSDTTNYHGLGTGTEPIYQETNAGKEITLGDNVIGRYVRVYVHGAVQSNGVTPQCNTNHIVELMVFGHEVPNEDPYYNKGMYFISIPDIYKTLGKYNATPTFGSVACTKVEAIYTKTTDSNAKTTYRMIELENGVFSTVIPPKGDGGIFDQIQYKVYVDTNNDGESDQTYITPLYKFTVEGDQIDVLVDEQNGSFTYKEKTRDCYFWDYSVNGAYWSGHPSSHNNILDFETLFVDKSNLPNWQKIYISHVKDGQVVSHEVSAATNIPNVYMHIFSEHSGMNELSLFAISNEPLNSMGDFVNASDNNQIYYFLYNIASKDNLIILNNFNNLDRVVNVFENITTTYIGFRDQAYGRIIKNEYGGLIPTDGKIQYRLPSDLTDDANSGWIDMVQSTGQSNVDEQVFFAVISSTPTNQIDFIQFKILDGTTTDGVTTYTDLYKTDVLEVDNTHSIPCFFADTFQKISNSYKSANGKITGIWTSLYDTNTHSSDSLDIPIEENESYNPSYYYGEATFYDYFMDYEISGKDVSESVNGQSNVGLNGHDSSIGAGIFNYSISEYFKEKTNGMSVEEINKVYPFYFRNVNNASGGPLYNELFRKDTGTISEDNRSPSNQWESGLNYAYDFVDKQLSSNGELTTNGIVYPQYDVHFLKGSNTIKTQIGYTYNNVDFPFMLNEDGYWEYDSTKEKYAVRMKEDLNSGYYLDLTNSGVVSGSGYGTGSGIPNFFPFNDSSDGSLENKKNMLFGMKMELSFSITETGTVTIKDSSGNYVNKDIIFEFMGDDDFFAYIDGLLCLDLGGIHNALYGEINFNTGEVVTKKLNQTNGSFVVDESQASNVRKQTNIYELFANNGKYSSKEEFSKSEHTLTVFFSERGGSSGLRIKFNFPRNNELSISNDVDISNANLSMFEEALSGLDGLFKYTIKNQVTTDAALSPKDSAGYLTSLDVVKYFDITYQNPAINTITNTTGVVSSIQNDGTYQYINVVNQNDDNYSKTEMEDSIINNEYWTKISYKNGTNTTVDLTGMEYLRFDLYYDEFNYTLSNGSDIYVRLVDEYGNTIQSNANACTYGSYSNIVFKDEWSTIRIDLNKLQGSNTNFDRTKIKSVEFAFAQDDLQAYISDVVFRGVVAEVKATGFDVSSSQISDYGSLSNAYVDGKYDYSKAYLSEANGAWYTLYGDGYLLQNMIRNEGQITIKDNEKVSFVDKFREGSYLQIFQSNNDLNALFDTRWTIKEDNRLIDDNWLSIYPNQKSVMNDASILDNTITYVEGINAADDRLVLDYINENNDYIYAYDKSGNQVNNNTIVYRSYFDPDNKQKSNINLSVEYENKLKVGGIVITKVLEFDDPEVMKKDHTFNFHIHYKNVGGLALEKGLSDLGEDSDNGLCQVVTIKIPAETNPTGNSRTVSKVIYGIPINTEYEIHEINEVPEGLEIGNIYEYVQPTILFEDTWNADGRNLSTNSHNANPSVAQYKLNGVDVDYKIIKGTVKESIQETKFINYQPHLNTEIKIVKELQNAVYTKDTSFVFHLHYSEGTKDKLMYVVVDVKAYQTNGSTIISSLSDKTIYQIHEVNEEDLVGLEIAKQSTTLADDTELSPIEGEKAHDIALYHSKDEETNDFIPIKDVETLTYEDLNGNIQTCKDIKMLAKAKAGASRHKFTFTNGGPNTLIVQKTDQYNSPLVGAGFTVYSDNGSTVAASQQFTDYYFRNEINKSDSNYIALTNSYLIDGVYYPTYQLNDNKLYYYVPLSEGEKTNYLSGNMTTEQRNRVVALTVFEDLPNGIYSIKETTTPSGYTGFDKDKSITVKLPLPENSIISTQMDEIGNTATFDSAIINSELNNVQFTITNTLNKGSFTFYKVDKEGNPIQGAKFALYKLNCNNSSHTESDHDKLIEFNSDGSVSADSCWHLESVITSIVDGNVTFNNLSPNEEYRLVEIETSSDLYILPTGQWVVKYENAMFKVTSSFGNPPAFSGSGTATDPYLVRNYLKTDLPYSGGRGWFYLVGAWMIVLVLGYWGYILFLNINLKKRKRMSK